MPLDKTQLQDKTETAAKHQPVLICATCNTPITTEKYAMSIKGGHEHTVFNPAGVLFHIGCFSHVENLHQHGKPSSDFSWFKNYKWQIATCCGCQTHLGWRFSGVGLIAEFHGLILNKLKKS